MTHRHLSTVTTDVPKGWLYNALAQALWGTGGNVISLVNKALPIPLLVGLRHGLGALLLGGHIIIKRKGAIFKTVPWRHAIALGILAGAAPDLLVTYSVRQTNGVIAILLARLEVPLGVLFAHFLLKERVTRKAYIASLVGIIGTGFISYRPGHAFSLHSGFYLGIATGIAAGVAWGLAAVYAKYILNRRVNSLALTFIRLSVGSISSLILSWIIINQSLKVIFQQLHVKDWLLILYLGIFNSGIAYLLFYRSMEHIDAHIAQILMGISMLVTVIFGLILGVPISLLQWFGIILIVGSLYLVKPPKLQTDEA